MKETYSPYELSEMFPPAYTASSGLSHLSSRNWKLNDIAPGASPDMDAGEILRKYTDKQKPKSDKELVDELYIEAKRRSNK